MKPRFFSSPAFAVFLATELAIVIFWLLPIGRWSAGEASDYLHFYEPVARSLLDGGGLRTPSGSAALVYPPGFPATLAGLFGLARWTGTPEALWIQGFTLVALGLTSCLLYWLAEGLLGRRGALLAAGLWITCPFHLWVATQPHSEIPFLLLLYGMFAVYAVLLRRGHAGAALACGMLCGLAGLVRPIVVFLPAVLAIGVIVSKPAEFGRSLRNCAVIVVGFLLAVLPWQVFAYQQTGRVILLSTAGPMGVVDGLTFGVEQQGIRGQVEMPAGVRAIMDDVAARHRRGDLATMPAVIDVIREKVSDDPVSFARLMMWKAARAWYGTDAISPLERYAVGVQLFYFALVIPGAVIWWRQGRSARPWIIATGLIVAYFWAMCTVVLSIVRYMTPVLGVFFLCAAVGGDRVLTAAARRWRLHASVDPARGRGDGSHAATSMGSVRR